MVPLKLVKKKEEKKEHICYYDPHSCVSYYFIYFVNTFATMIRTALLLTILFTLFQTEFFQYPGSFKNWGGGIYLKRIHNKITQPMYYYYCFYELAA